MFFSDILKKIRERNQKRQVIRDLIVWLQIDENQKQLYLESLEILEVDSLDIFYEKLTTIISNAEQKRIEITQEKTEWALETIRKKEQIEEKKEKESFNILFDNI